MFVNFFIRRPVFATVCSLLIILAGAIAIPTLPIAQFPQLAPPQVTVTAFYNGANSQAVETSVTTLLEQAINGAEGMNYISSVSGNDGTSQITATFHLERNLDIAAVDVQNRASSALGRLPAEVQQTGVTVGKNSGTFIMAAGFYSDKGQYDQLFISNYLDLYVRDALKRIKGVGDVIIFGERKYAMRLWLDPVRLAKRSLTAQDVVNALREQNVQVAAGQVGQAPIAKGQNFQISVRAVGRLREAKEFEAIILKRGADGSLVQLRDVGRAELGAESYAGNLSYNGYDAIGIGVQQLSTANALDVDKAVKDELSRLSAKFPPGLKYQIAFDTTTAVGESIREVLTTLVEAIIIVILVIFLFLQSWRSTLIPAITIPVSLIGTFAFVKLFGFSINTLTLFGITLATGLVVDDAIVVIENVERHLEEGIRDPRRASEVAMGEVTSAVIATSLVLIAVFIPISLFPGSTGRLYQQFALTIAFSIGLSAFNALTLTPALSALLLRHSSEKKNPIFRGFNAIISGGTKGYTGILQKLERAKLPVFAVFVLGLVAAWYIYRIVPTSFVPDEDQGYLMALVQTPEGASLEYTTQKTRAAAAILAANHDINGVFAVPGFSFTGAAPNRAMIFANLRPFGERKGNQHTAAAVLNSVRGPLLSIPDALVIPLAPPAIQGLGAFGGFQFQLEQTGSGSLEDMQNVLNGFLMKARGRKELTGLFSTFSARDPQFEVNVDREKAKSLGVSFTEISSALQVFMGSQYVNDFDFNNRSYRVYVQADEQYRRQPRDLREFYVRSDSGQMVPLDNLVTVKETTTSSVIEHYNIFRTTAINGAAAPGYSSGQAIAAMEDLAKQALPVGYTFEWTGLTLEEIQSGSQAIILFALGLLVVYLTLSAQYESFVLPFIILLAVPMAIFGALGAQFLRGQQNDVYCQIGLVMLIGLASKNAILIVEFAEQLQMKGMGLFESAVEAARLRLRPILMTSIAFILGVLPLVFATGAGSAGRNSVGTTVFGGMIISTFLNLFIIPILYVIVRSFLPAPINAVEPIPNPEGD
ncbi:Hydrophobe/amphiphile efflux-1 HAE1 [Candidatus Koribacter versatilis Ellin345]|uniref:Hydrophobe/amphiphile efflux-1 HAE1 n=1 Tax=Koribacter versatilis (strain Ellin345) TaxID=204669 RepID=Q1IMT2_KORVE|nr:multidrug efflux RND transporter permease subunit [Candidatus Koribacter versatilis]ABF41818.1 Hydrophobe/amphiphile efflux-1 HAE1 [Candidatus Koribacter versatilis Ellin345]